LPQSREKYKRLKIFLLSTIIADNCGSKGKISSELVNCELYLSGGILGGDF
jgi:hypothetical protein